MLVLGEEVVNVGIVDGPFPVFEQQLELFFSSLEVVVPILSEFFAVLEPG